MLANFEQRKDSERVWAGRYRNLHNLAHWHMEHELIYVEEGEVSVSHNDREYILKQGDLFFIHSGQVHYINANEDSIVQILMYDSSFLPSTMNTYIIKQALIKQPYNFCTIFDSIKYEQQKKDSFYIEKIQLLLQTLLLDIYRHEEIMKKGDVDSDDYLTSYKELLQEIQTQYHSITFSKAADMMGLSTSYFSRYFHKISGMTFSRYVNTIRIEKAIEYLKESKYTITEISIQCGFDTIRHFNRTFKEITGLTPRQMPKDYILYHYTTKVLNDHFDPTSKESILL